MKKLLYRGLFWRGLNYFTVFLVTLAVAKLFQASESGSIYYLVNNLAFLILVTGLSLESATGFYSAKNEIDQPELIGISLCMAIISMAVNALLIRWIFPTGVQWIPAVMYCGGVVLTSYFVGLFNSHYDYVFPNAVVVSVNLVIILLIQLFPLELRQNNSELFLKIYFGSFLLTGILLAARYISFYGKSIALPSVPVLKKVFRYALLALVANVLFFLVYRVDYWFVNRNCTNAELGNYIQVSKLGQIFMLVPGIIGGTVFTRTIKSETGAQLGELQVLSRLLLMAYLSLMLFIGFFGNWLFPLIYGPTFNLMYLPFLLLMPGILSLATVALVTAFNGGQGNIITNLIGSFITLAVIVIGNFIFSRRYGIYAAAAISSMGYISSQLYIMWRLKQRYKQLRIIDFFIPQYHDLIVLRSLVGRKQSS